MSGCNTQAPTKTKSTGYEQSKPWLVELSAEIGLGGTQRRPESLRKSLRTQIAQMRVCRFPDTPLRKKARKLHLDPSGPAPAASSGIS